MYLLGHLFTYLNCLYLDLIMKCSGSNLCTANQKMYISTSQHKYEKLRVQVNEKYDGREISESVS